MSVDGTALPRYVAPGGTGRDPVARHVVPIPGDLARRLPEAAVGYGTDVDSLLLAAHVKVLAVLAGERTVTVDRRLPEPPGATAPFEVTVPDGTWHGLVSAVGGHPARRRPLPGRPRSEVVVDIGTGTAPGPLAAPAVLESAVTAGDVPEIRITYRTDVVSGEYAGRIAGYLRTAVRQLVETPDAEHHLQSLLSPGELHHQLHELVGERRELPARTFVDLFGEQARATPDAPAVAHNDRTWSYRELSRHADLVARRLLDEGLRAEDVVAVVMDRDLHWAASLLGVLRAGGAYLPVRPDFPPRRVATQLDRSDCQFVIAGANAAGLVMDTQRESGRERTVLAAEDVFARPGDGTVPEVALTPENLAYIYFTSGSTGAPKGATGEHGGMLNHLYAKIETVAMHAGDVVAQTASQCFDISLWQLISPWLVGASVRIIDTDTQLDVPRFVDTLLRERVSVAQLVPSYFEVLVTYLEQHPRELGALRSVSITGEALKLQPVRRWFALYPDIQLVNAYGATEVSDDTMHEVLEGIPERDFVSVGRSLRNVNTYVVDEHLRLVPLGTPGEIVFSGVCVGRGYLNDPERTRQSFVSDPYRPGTRMYRTGDFGRRLPEGTIEFLGRRDQQVKIRGFRIEIGEIENRLLAVPGVRDGAVVTVDASDQGRHLVAFYTGADEPAPEAVREELARSLPEYMVPSYVHRLERLPVTENGKINKKQLGELAKTVGHADHPFVAPGTPTERRLATAWAEALNVPLERIGRQDSFFELGGTSLAAVRLIVRLDRALSLADLVGNPVLAELAALVDARSGGAGAAREAALLQPLSAPAEPVATLVCFPFAGGNAVNFRVLAERLHPYAIAVHGVELPAHDFAGAGDGLQGVEEIARRVHAEIRSRIRTPVMLWGHCAGSAHALAVTRLLEADGAGPVRVFLGALLFDDDETLRDEIAEVSGLDDRAIAARLMEDALYVELDGLKVERAGLVASSYRHDVCTTNQWLIDLRADPPSPRLRSELHVVVAADDPTTKDFTARHRDWELVASRVVLHQLDEGGHYFTGTRPAETARIVVEAGG